MIATGKSTGAKPWISSIRKRAGLPDLENPTITDIMNERRREFLGEGKRYFALVRQGKDIFLSTLQAFSDHYRHEQIMGASKPQEKDMLLPIPLAVMNIQSTWKNNDGY